MTIEAVPSRPGSEPWEPEDPLFWERAGRHIARRNLLLSTAAEHLAFSVWGMWSVLVLFLSPGTGLPLTAGGRFLLVGAPLLAGGLLRLPYARATARLGARDRTVLATALLLVPASAAVYAVQRPGTPLWALVLVAATAGVGGADCPSARGPAAAHPRRLRGRARAFAVRGAFSGLAGVQLAGLLVLVCAGTAHPAAVAAVYLPLAALVAVVAALRMDDLPPVRAVPGARRVGTARAWWPALLRAATLGTFLGCGAACGLVLQSRFGTGAVAAAAWAVAGPLLGTAARPAAARYARARGAARATVLGLLALAAASAVLLIASAKGWFTLFAVAFTALVAVGGAADGAARPLLVALAARQAEETVLGGGDAARAFSRARRLARTADGAGTAAGALGGAAVVLLLMAGYGTAAPGSSGMAVCWALLGFYAACVGVTWAVWLRHEHLGAAPAGELPGTSRA
ncbi:MFS transporter [Streptomyces gamaensis]|uniref:MFS transporter n=1 Tax=Streptomyces gamaensis TaxID=1763542 RepID=A0ABW0ZB33_9ACTN